MARQSHVGSCFRFIWPSGCTRNRKSQSGELIDASEILKTKQDELKPRLENSGIKVILLNVERINKFKMLHDYSQFTNIKADAILEVAPVHVGLKEEIGKVHFTQGELSPDIALAYRLQSVASGEVLIESNLYYSSYDYSNWSYWKGATLLGPKEHIFKDKKSVSQNKAEAIGRPDHTIRGATEYIADMVTK